MSGGQTGNKSGRKFVAIACAIMFLMAAGLSLWAQRMNYRGTIASQPVEVEGTRFTYEYVAPKNRKLMATYERVRDVDLLHKLTEIQAVDGVFVLPEPLHFVAAECQADNAFYYPPKSEMVLCYEFVDSLLAKGKTVAREKKEGKEFPQKYLVGALRFIMLHELGHALIAQLNLPITGREETAADEFAAVMMLQYVDQSEQLGTVENSILYASSALDDEKQNNMSVVADTHEMGKQRYFNLLCTIYGSDPSRYLTIVTDGDLPEWRAKSCHAYTERVMSTWGQLLTPHMGTKYQKSFDDWMDQSTHGRAAQEKNSSPYVR